LPPAARLLVVACVASWVLVAVCVLALGLSIDLPGGTFDIPNQAGVPKALALIVYLALAATAAALALASFSPGWRLGGLTRVALALLGVAFAVAPFSIATAIDEGERASKPAIELSPEREREFRAYQAKAEVVIPYLERQPGERQAQQLRVIKANVAKIDRLFDADEELRIAPAFLPGFLRFCGWAGLAAAIAVVLSGAFVRASERRRLLAAAAAAAPYLLGLVAYVVLLATTLRPAVPLGMLGTNAIVAIVGSVGLFVPAVLLWQAVAGADAARDLGRGAARTLERLPYALTAFLAVKLIWLGLAYSGALPGLLGGGNGAIEASADDDLLSWALACLAAGAAGVWLAKRCSLRVREDWLSLLAAVIVAALIAPLILAAVALMALAILSPFVDPTAWTVDLLIDVGEWLAARLLAVQVAAVYAAGVAGLLLWWRRGLDALSAFLLIFCLMALPRAIGITAAWGTPEEGGAGRYELATLDTAITLVVLALLVGPWRRSRLVTEAGLLVVVVCSTTIAYAGTFVSSLWGDGAFYLALLFPMLYGLTLGARGLNRMDPRRATRVLAFVGAGAGLLAISLVQLTMGLAGPGHFSGGEIGRLFIAPPLAAILVAATCSALRKEGATTNAAAPPVPTGQSG
jgi:hypothetical protein